MGMGRKTLSSTEFQNRVFVGFGFKRDPGNRHRVEVGYLNQYMNRSAGTDLSNHLVSINFYLNP